MRNFNCPNEAHIRAREDAQVEAQQPIVKKLGSYDKAVAHLLSGGKVFNGLWHSSREEGFLEMYGQEVFYHENKESFCKCYFSEFSPEELQRDFNSKQWHSIEYPEDPVEDED